ncbi:MAG: TlpA family protein disulfide reductase [Beijerinckiaceae bacterium]|jgi:thiol-disulfide isomerase/thioredoxin|nr:TlpA family protein disulfide reductase [Beijerinckiaceae bacterium]
MTSPKPARSTLKALAGPLLMGVILLGASLYAFGGIDKLFKPTSPDVAACKAAQPLTAALKPLAKGEVAALQIPTEPARLIDLSFKTPEGRDTTLTSFRGKAVLVNLWATWCAPCRHEMPALDRLQKAYGGADFEVVAINIDTRNFDKPKQFLDEVGVKALAQYADPSAKIFQDLKAVGRAFGMPTTILLDKNGCELAYLAGPAEWSSPDAFAFIGKALGRAP